MSVHRLLARLTAKTASLEPPSRGKTGLGSDEIQGALGYVDDPISCLLVQARYIGHLEVVPELVERVQEVVWEVATEEKWKRASLERVARLSRQAVYETVLPRKCPKCNGREILWMKSGVVQKCKRCNGGKIRLWYSDAATARAIGLPYKVYRHSWKFHYARVIRYLIYMEDAGIEDIRRALRDS